MQKLPSAVREAEHDVDTEAKAKTIIIGAHIAGMGDGDAARFIGLVDIACVCVQCPVRAGGHCNFFVCITQSGNELLIERAKAVG